MDSFSSSNMFFSCQLKTKIFLTWFHRYAKSVICREFPEKLDANNSLRLKKPNQTAKGGTDA